MKKLKIYLDTSVISHLKQDDAPEKMADTLKLWKMFNNGKYKAVLSNVTLDEINQCKQEKIDMLTKYLNQIKYDTIIVNDEVMAYAEKIVDFGILTKKSFDDCMHIAAAVVTNCDMIASWNFKHIVNLKTMNGVKMVSTAEGYKDILISIPTIIVEGENTSG